MAKINFVTKKITDSILRSVQSLKSQQYDVRLWTSVDQKNCIPADLSPVHFPFQTWSIFEGFRFLTQFLRSGEAQVFHFFLSDKISSSEKFLIQAFEVLPGHTSIVTVTGEFPIAQNSKLKSLLQTCSIFTFESYGDLLQAHQLFPKKRLQKRVAIPPLMEILNENYLAMTGADERLLAFFDACEPGLFMIAPLLRDDFIKALPEHFPTLYIQDAGTLWTEFDWKHHQIQTFETAKKPFYFFHRAVNDGSVEDRSALDGSFNSRSALDGSFKSRSALDGSYEFFPNLPSSPSRKPVIFIAGLRLSISQQIRYMELSLTRGIPIVLDTRQSMNYSALWKHGQNCWVLPEEDLRHHGKSVLQKLKNSVEFKGEILPPESGPLDDYKNELSRLYHLT